jgi:DNA-binding MarR family transcriptional regulator
MTQHKDLQLASDLRTVVTRLVKKMRRESVTGQQLSMTERSTLALLQQHKELLPSVLAAMEHITNQSMSQIVSHLLELGYISRTASVTDKRKVIIALTTEGEKTIMRVRTEREEWLAKAINESCTDEEAALLKQAIGPLTKLVDF